MGANEARAVAGGLDVAALKPLMSGGDGGETRSEPKPQSTCFDRFGAITNPAERMGSVIDGSCLDPT